MDVENITEELINDTIDAEILDFEVFDTRDAMNVVAYSTMGSGRTYCQAQFSSSWLG